MTSKPRKGAGTAPADRTAKAGENNPTPVDTSDKAGKQDDPQPEKHITEGGNAADEGATVEQQSAVASTLPLSGEPQPAKVEQGMARPETGVAQEAFAGGEPDTAATGDTDRNGRPDQGAIDTSGELRHREDAIPTAAHGGTERNGLPVNMEGTVNREFGGNGDPEAKLLNDGVRAEVGAGTGTEAPKDERPQYPSTLLTRSSSKAAPTEPADVKNATQPRLGDVQTSTDPTMAASTMPSMPGDATVKLVNGKGDEVTPSEFFEVPEGIQGRSFRRVKHRVSEVFTVRHVKTPSKRLLFTEGQMVPVEVAQTLIELHG